VSEQTPDREALDTAKVLTDGMSDLAAEVKALHTYGRHNRRFIVFDVALTVLLTVVTVIAVHAGQSASSATADASAARTVAAAQHTNLIVSCRLGNQTRASEVQLWSHLAAISKPQPGTTPQQKAKSKRAITGLLAYIRRTFAPRPCAKLYRLP
jgi:regulator of extracellular matrix RemA (YlzA/DUF370 family)